MDEWGADFFKAGCVALGVGSSLLKPDLLSSQNWPELSRLAAHTSTPSESFGPETDVLSLVGTASHEYCTVMTAAKVIEEINDLPPDEQAKVIEHALKLARRRQLSADELGELADRLATTDDPAEIIRLRSAMTRGFYGE